MPRGGTARRGWRPVLAGALAALALAGCGGGGGFPDIDAIEDALRDRVASGLGSGRSAGEASCVEDRIGPERRTYDCQVQIFALRPRDDAIVRFRVVARSDGGWTARRTGTVTFT